MGLNTRNLSTDFVLTPLGRELKFTVYPTFCACEVERERERKREGGREREGGKGREREMRERKREREKCDEVKRKA